MSKKAFFDTKIKTDYDVDFDNSLQIEFKVGSLLDEDDKKQLLESIDTINEIFEKYLKEEK